MSSFGERLTELPHRRVAVVYKTHKIFNIRRHLEAQICTIQRVLVLVPGDLGIRI
jgi:hypothetical protein